MSDDTFINYTNPTQRTDRALRQRVAVYIGTHYRNRSRPTVRLDAGHRPGTDFISLGVLPEQGTEEAAATVHHPQLIATALSVPRDHSGTRQDPFDAYPATQSRGVEQGIDHFIYRYAPAHLLRPQLISPESGTVAVQEYFQYALQHKVMFEATVALALADSTISTWVDNRADRLVLYHYGQAISNLRQALLNAQAVREDAILFAIMALMGIDYLLNDLAAFRSHLMGMRQVVRLRGGINALGWPNFLKPGLLSLEAFWTYISHQPHLIAQTTPLLQPTAVSDTASASSSDGPSQNIDEIALRVPHGFRVLAGQQRIGFGLLHIIQQVVDFDSSLHHGAPTSFTYGDGVRKYLNFKTHTGEEVTAASNLQTCEQLARMLVDSKLTIVERVCCIGLFIYLLGFNRSEQLSPIYFAQLQHHAQELMDVQLVKDDFEAAELAAWTMFVVSSTMFPSTLPALPSNYQDDVRFALTVQLVEHFSSRRTWDEMETSLRSFLWNEPCMRTWKNVWDTGVDHLRNPVS